MCITRPSAQPGIWCCLSQEEDLKRLHEGAIKNDPFISKALGPAAKIERMKAASLRLGGQGLRTTYDDHLLIIGDAAGHIDPLTGEGIHTAIMVRPSLLRTQQLLQIMCAAGSVASSGTRWCQACSVSRSRFILNLTHGSGLGYFGCWHALRSCF